MQHKNRNENKWHKSSSPMTVKLIDESWCVWIRRETFLYIWIIINKKSWQPEEPSQMVRGIWRHMKVFVFRGRIKSWQWAWSEEQWCQDSCSQLQVELLRSSGGWSHLVAAALLYFFYLLLLSYESVMAGVTAVSLKRPVLRRSGRSNSFTCSNVLTHSSPLQPPHAADRGRFTPDLLGWRLWPVIPLLWLFFFGGCRQW